MKIIISESQLSFLLPESYNQVRIDALLDKINAMGINSLTDKERTSLTKLSNGEDDEPELHDVPSYKVTHNQPQDYDPRDDEDSYSMHDDDVMDAPYDKPINPSYLDRMDQNGSENDGEEKSNLLNMFMYFSPEFEELNVNGKIWFIESRDEDEQQHLHVANQDYDFYVTPFWDGEDSITIETNDGNKSTYKIHNTPKNEGEMKDFVRIFYSRLLPKIIEKVVQ